MAVEEPLPKLNPAETAVLICKFQNDFAAEGGKIYDTVKEVMEITNMKENSIHFVDLARKAGCTIVHCPISLERVSTNIKPAMPNTKCGRLWCCVVV
jgi:nicotinamidase-related amidase